MSPSAVTEAGGPLSSRSRGGPLAVPCPDAGSPRSRVRRSPASLWPRRATLRTRHRARGARAWCAGPVPGDRVMSRDGSVHVLAPQLTLTVAGGRPVPRRVCSFLSMFGLTRASTAASAASADGPASSLFLSHREAFPGHPDSPSSLPSWQDLCVACPSASSKLGTSFGEERVWEGAASSLANASGAAGAPRPRPRDLRPDGRRFLRGPSILEDRPRAGQDGAEGRTRSGGQRAQPSASHPHPWG